MEIARQCINIPGKVNPAVRADKGILPPPGRRRKQEGGFFYGLRRGMYKTGKVLKKGQPKGAP